VVVCGAVLVVSCVVLFLLCVCVCDLFLYSQAASDPVHSPPHSVGAPNGSKATNGANGVEGTDRISTDGGE